MGQDGAKMGQDGAKIGPRWANIGPRWAQDVAKAQVAKNSKNPRVFGVRAWGRQAFLLRRSGSHVEWMPRPAEARRPWPDLRAYAQQPARGPLKGRGQQERREEGKGKRREGNVGDEQEEGVGCDAVARGGGSTVVGDCRLLGEVGSTLP